MNKSLSISFLIIVPLVVVLGYFFFVPSTYVPVEAPIVVDETVKKADVEILIERSTEAMTALKNRDYNRLSSMVSRDGLTVALIPYNIFMQSVAFTNGEEDEFIATTSAKRLFTKEEIANVSLDTTEYIYGNTDGKGDPIKGTINYFFEKWVYNHNYIVAPEVVTNEIRGTGNSLNTITEDALGMDFVVYHFSGFDPQYEGMDWTSMYLIFDKENGEYKLRAIVKDNWTI